jgi:hypothetical protein
MGWVVKATPLSLYSWAPRLAWTGAENLAVTGIRFPDLTFRSESVYRLSYPGLIIIIIVVVVVINREVLIIIP